MVKGQHVGNVFQARFKIAVLVSSHLRYPNWQNQVYCIGNISNMGNIKTIVIWYIAYQVSQNSIRHVTYQYRPIFETLVSSLNFAYIVPYKINEIVCSHSILFLLSEKCRGSFLGCMRLYCLTNCIDFYLLLSMFHASNSWVCLARNVELSCSMSGLQSVSARKSSVNFLKL